MVASICSLFINSTHIDHLWYCFRCGRLSSDDARGDHKVRSGLAHGSGEDTGQESVAQGGKAFQRTAPPWRVRRVRGRHRAPRQRNSACDGLVLSWGTPKSREEAGRHQRGQRGWGRIAKGKGVEVKPGGVNASRAPPLCSSLNYHSFQISTCANKYWTSPSLYYMTRAARRQILKNYLSKNNVNKTLPQLEIF